MNKLKEKNYTIHELRQMEQYPGTAYEQTSHYSRYTHKVIKHRDYHRKYSLVNYVLMFFIFAVSGWIWEVGIHFIEDGIFVNRGAFNGPWLPIYGFGGVVGIAVFKKMCDRQVETFMAVIAVFSFVEYMTSLYLEKVNGLKYWDYNGYFLNLNGRICFEGVLIFGFAGCAGIYIIGPFLDDLLKKIPVKSRTIISIVVIAAFVFDFVYTQFHPNTGKGITDYALNIYQKIKLTM